MKTIIEAFDSVSMGVAHPGRPTIPVPELVRRGIERTQARASVARAAVSAERSSAALERVARLYRREARWWGVLACWAYRTPEFEVFGTAAVMAEIRVEDRAADYEDMAASAAARLSGGGR